MMRIHVSAGESEHASPSGGSSVGHQLVISCSVLRDDTSEWVAGVHRSCRPSPAVTCLLYTSDAADDM
eukprot:7616269-Alexandrium_andersonii.AAC.1